jgi:organic hydroperoxide reductase OsmC/OhrA
MRKASPKDDWASVTERPPRMHHYTAHLSWRGSTGAGYEDYDRDHEAQAPPAKARLVLSADHAFRGRLEHLNPEQLLVIAASSCQALSFLALAARARIDVREYNDQAEGVMPEDDPPARIARIVLRPRITVASPATKERVARLIALAHRECYIANSLRTKIDIEPSIVVLGSA